MAIAQLLNTLPSPMWDYAQQAAELDKCPKSMAIRLPSGELTFCNGKSPFFMGKSTISMVIFHCYVSSPEGIRYAHDIYGCPSQSFRAGYRAVIPSRNLEPIHSWGAQTSPSVPRT